jgi:hypothetical protein
MKPIWLLQSSGITVSESDYWFASNTRFLDYGLIPFTDSISNIEAIYSTWKEYGDKFIVRGGTKLLKSFSEECLPTNNIHDAAFRKALLDGVWWDKEKFDQKYYSTFDLPLVNKDAEYMILGESYDRTWSIDKFIKPSSDGKAFSGGILRAGQTIRNFLENTMRKQNIESEMILIADLKNTQAEYRFFCIDGQVITGSQYMKNGMIRPESIPTTHAAYSVAKEYIGLYRPSEIFVMDIGMFDGEWKIVEYNCANCSGVYRVDLQKLVDEWESFVLSNVQCTKGKS